MIVMYIATFKKQLTLMWWSIELATATLTPYQPRYGRGCWDCETASQLRAKSLERLGNHELGHDHQDMPNSTADIHFLRSNNNFCDKPTFGLKHRSSPSAVWKAWFLTTVAVALDSQVTGTTPPASQHLGKELQVPSMGNQWTSPFLIGKSW